MPPLPGGELSDMVFDLNLSRGAVIKLNSEGRMTLDNRRGGARSGGQGQECVRVLSGDFVELHPHGFRMLKILGGDLKVAGLTVV